MIDTAKRIEIAEYFCDLFEKFSINPPVDRMLPEYRVANDDITRKFPEFTIHDKSLVHPYIKRAMKRRGLTFKR